MPYLLDADAGDFDAAVSFFRDRLVIPLSLVNNDRQYDHFRMANDDLVEVFGPENPYKEHHRNVVIALRVEDIGEARAELMSRGVEFVTETRIWKHEASCYFVGPVGLLFEIQSVDRITRPCALSDGRSGPLMEPGIVVSRSRQNDPQ